MTLPQKNRKDTQCPLLASRFMHRYTCVHVLACTHAKMNKWEKGMRKTWIENHLETKAQVHSSLSEASKERWNRFSLSRHKKTRTGTGLWKSHLSTARETFLILKLPVSWYFVMAALRLDADYLSMCPRVSLALCRKQQLCPACLWIRPPGPLHVAIYVRPVPDFARSKQPGRRICYKCPHSPLWSQTQILLWI